MPKAKERTEKISQKLATTDVKQRAENNHKKTKKDTKEIDFDLPSLSIESNELLDKQEDIGKHGKPVDSDLTAVAIDLDELLDPSQESEQDEDS